MKLEDYKEAYQEYSKLTSDSVRQLAFAGIASAWIFRVEEGNSSTLPGLLRWGIVFLSLSLLCDLLQYASGTVIWRMYYRRLERTSRPTADHSHSEWLPAVIWSFFVAKVILLIAGYFAIVFGIVLTKAITT